MGGFPQSQLPRGTRPSTLVACLGGVMADQRSLLFGVLAFFAAVALALGILGLRLSDRELDSPARRDPDGMLRGFEVGAERLGGASFVTGLAVAPDGSIFYAEHLTGRIGVLSPSADGGLSDSTVLELELPEAGRLFHLVLHPDWPSEASIYFTAHHGTGRDQRLALYRADLLDPEGVMLERVVGGLPTEDAARGAQADHFGSALAVCDGYLYLSVGDTDSPGPGSHRRGGIRFRAQDPTFAEGKLLRYRLDGRELEPAGVLGEEFPVFALGFRNVFSMDCDPRTGWPVVADNGAAGFDQLRLVEPGSNHEWPNSDRRAVTTPPLLDTGYAAIAPTGIVARVDEAGRTELVFSGFHTESVYTLRVDSAGERDGEVVLRHRSAGVPLSLTRDREGCIYLGTTDGIWLLRESSCPRQVGVAAAGGDARFEGDPAAVYLGSCAACHGLEREGAEGPALRDERLTRADDFYLRTILEGRAERGMPSWGAAGMSDEQARRLLAYLRSPGS